MSPRKQALILDFGGVISRTLFETHALTEATLGLPAGSLQWKGPFDPATDPLWQAMQAEQISEREYWHARAQEVGRMIGEDWEDMQTFVKRARGADVQAVIRPEAIWAIDTAKAAGHRLAVLSNELDLFYGADFRGRLPLLSRFDVIVDATHTGILKPDPRAYEMCLAQLGVAAVDAVFVDDQSRNVEGARQVGLNTVHFDVRNPADSYSIALNRLDMNG